MLCCQVPWDGPQWRAALMLPSGYDPAFRPARGERKGWKGRKSQRKNGWQSCSQEGNSWQLSWQCPETRSRPPRPRWHLSEWRCRRWNPVRPRQLVSFAARRLTDVSQPPEELLRWVTRAAECVTTCVLLQLCRKWGNTWLHPNGEGLKHFWGHRNYEDEAFLAKYFNQDHIGPTKVQLMEELMCLPFIYTIKALK